MLSNLIGFLILTRLAHSIGIFNGAKSSDAETYSVYDSIKQSNLEAQFINEKKKKKVLNSLEYEKEVKIEDFPSHGIHGSRKYIARLLKSLRPTGGTGSVSAPVFTSFLPDGSTVITDETADEQLAEFLLESVVNIGLVQAKVNTALKNYKADLQKSMIKELRKIATEVYQELTSDSSDSDDDSDDEDIGQDQEDEERVVHATKFPLYTKSLRQVVKEEDFDKDEERVVHASKFPLYTKSQKQVVEEDYFDSEDEIDRVSERRDKFFFYDSEGNHEDH